MFRRLTKKRSLVGLSVVASLAIAAGAFAYFTSTGSGTSQASVGNPSNWSVTFPTAATGTMYPGAGSTVIPYTVTNSNTGHQQLSATTTSVVTETNGDIESHGADVPGCLASWFHTANTSPAANDLAGGASENGSVTVTMDDAAVSQNSCMGATPDVSVSAS